MLNRNSGGEERNQRVLSAIREDRRITTTDIALLFALMICQLRDTSSDHFQVSRSVLMNISKISSTRTYHKSIRNLMVLGYIHYLPSYHPRLGSRVCWAENLD